MPKGEYYFPDRKGTSQLKTWLIQRAFEHVRIVEPPRQDTDHEDSEGEAQVYAKGQSFAEERKGTKNAKVTTTQIKQNDASNMSSSARDIVLAPSPRQAYATENQDSVD